MHFFQPALALTRQAIPTDPAERAADEGETRAALMHSAAARAAVHGRITTAGAQRDEALLHGEHETVHRTEREINLATLDLERLNLLERRLRQRLVALAVIQEQELAS